VTRHLQSSVGWRGKQRPAGNKLRRGAATTGDGGRRAGGGGDGAGEGGRLTEMDGWGIGVVHPRSNRFHGSEPEEKSQEPNKNWVRGGSTVARVWNSIPYPGYCI
jgi:hypothetical protein